MANSVTGNIIAKTHQGLVPVTSDDDKTWTRDQAIGEWIQVAFEDATANAAVGKICAAYFPYACTIKSLQLVPGITGTAVATATRRPCRSPLMHPSAARRRTPRRLQGTFSSSA